MSVRAISTKTTRVCEVRVQKLNSVVACVSDVHFVCVRMYNNAFLSGKLQRSIALCIDCFQVNMIVHTRISPPSSATI